jgi:hypothetical protein
LLVCTLLIAAVPPPDSAFHILGATLSVEVVRNGATLPAAMVPFLKAGDLIEVSFPKGIQFSRAPRWHLVIADMHTNYLQHPPQFLLSDADLSRAKPGYVWKVRYDGHGTPLIFLVPENGNQYGHGIPQARSAITDLANRALLLRTSVLSADAEAKQTMLGALMRSMSTITPAELKTNRERIIAATQSLAGSDLSASPCFAVDVPESTQYACAADAITAGYGGSSKIDVAAILGNQLPIGVATYGMLIGAVYELLAKRKVFAHYVFVPGVMEPGVQKTNVYVSQQPDYDASARKPSTIVYFKIGSGERKTAAYAPPPALPVCISGGTLEVTLPFGGSPSYFRSHSLIVKTASQSFRVSASYDPIQGYTASLNPEEIAALRAGGSVQVQSLWGFDDLTSAPIGVLEPYPARWQLENARAPQVISGDSDVALTFTDPKGAMGSCTQTVAVQDGLGNAIPVIGITRQKGTVTATLDASHAAGALGDAVVTEDGGIPSAPLTFPIFPEMPKITSAVAYLPRGILVMRGTGLKYIDDVSLENTGITFSNGTPNADGSWTFTTTKPAPYQPAWQHQTMVVEYTLQSPDPRIAAADADVYYSPM